jgi:ferritin-like protein
MRFSETIKAMHGLARLEADAAYAYGLAMDRVGRLGDEALKGPLEQARQEHERHYIGLSNWLESQRVKPPHPSPDLRGRLSDALADLARGSADAQDALSALQAIERAMTASYEDATLRADLPKDLYAMLVSAYAENDRLLGFLQGALSEASVPA